MDERLRSDAYFSSFAKLTCDNGLKLFDASVAEVVKSAWSDVGVYF